MVTKGDKIVFAIVLLLAVGTFFFLKNRNAAKAGIVEESSKKDQKEKKGKKGGKKEDNPTPDGGISILQKWEMPASLNEISGIARIDGVRFACVQDEQGKIFIYNTADSKIEKEISFGDVGDYEGIAVVGTTAYVMRADGKLFEVSAFNSDKPSAKQHSTHLTAKQDVESLCYDPKNNRLLLAIKGKETDSKDYKGIYAFDLSSKKLSVAPVYKVDLTEGTAEDNKGKNKIQPSDIAVHPVTGDLYILDGPDSRLLVMGQDGATKQLYQLNTKDFAQPEGIDFAPEGDLFISNEANKGSGNILKVLISATP